MRTTREFVAPRGRDQSRKVEMVRASSEIGETVHRREVRCEEIDLKVQAGSASPPRRALEALRPGATRGRGQPVAEHLERCSRAAHHDRTARFQYGRQCATARVYWSATPQADTRSHVTDDSWDFGGAGD